jgi:hypothetical protein
LQKRPQFFRRREAAESKGKVNDYRHETSGGHDAGGFRTYF